jgi:hypothetical protein
MEGSHSTKSPAQDSVINIIPVRQEVIHKIALPRHHVKALLKAATKEVKVNEAKGKEAAKNSSPSHQSDSHTEEIQGTNAPTQRQDAASIPVKPEGTRITISPNITMQQWRIPWERRRHRRNFIS